MRTTRMRNRFRLGAGAAWALAASLLLTATAWAPVADAKDKSTSSRKAEAQEGEDFEGMWDLTAGQTLEIKGINGQIWAEPSAAKAEVRASKHGRRSDPSSVRIEVSKHAGGVTVCAIYPSSGKRENECEPGDGGHNSSHNNDVQVDFSVKVPKGVRLVAKTVNGSIDAGDLAGPVEARTVNGSIDVATTSTAQASTVNGAVRGRIGASSWSEEIEFTTVNGGITLELPEDLSADLSAKTVNGHISTDFPITVKGKLGRRSIRGTIGTPKAGNELALSTVNGSIRLLAIP